MKVIHFKEMSVVLPIKENETIEEIEDRLIEAVVSIGDGVVMSYKIVIEDDDASEGGDSK